MRILINIFFPNKITRVFQRSVTVCLYKEISTATTNVVVFMKKIGWIGNRGVATGYIGIYTLPKSGQVNFLWSTNDARTVIELIPKWVLKFYTSPKLLYLPQNFYTSQNKFLATTLIGKL